MRSEVWLVEGEDNVDERPSFSLLGNLNWAIMARGVAGTGGIVGFVGRERFPNHYSYLTGTRGMVGCNTRFPVCILLTICNRWCSTLGNSPHIIVWSRAFVLMFFGLRMWLKHVNKWPVYEVLLLSKYKWGFCVGIVHMKGSVDPLLVA